jgi:putative membrane protein
MFIVKILIKWIILSAAVIVVSQVVPGISVASWMTAFLVGIVLGFINTFIKPILQILSIPINILTLGLFGLVLNALLFWAVTYFVPSFTIAGFLPALIGSIIVSVIMWVAHWFVD